MLVGLAFRRHTNRFLGSLKAEHLKNSFRGEDFLKTLLCSFACLFDVFFFCCATLFVPLCLPKQQRMNGRRNQNSAGLNLSSGTL